MAATASVSSAALVACRPPFQSSSFPISSSSTPSRSSGLAHAFVQNHQSRNCPCGSTWDLCSSPRSCRRVHCSPRSMAPDEEKMTRRSPLDFPIEWERPRPGRRPDIFPQFSPMKTPLPQPPPTDPPEEDEEEEEKKEEEEKPEEEPEAPPKET